MKRIGIGLAAVIILLGGGIWLFAGARADTLPGLRLGTVERGSIESTVSATGTLGALRTVQVGTQVSGQVSALLVDFNDRVRQGQLIARIDATLSEQAVADAEAGLERAHAQLQQAQADYERNRELFETKAVTATELGTAESSWLQARAGVKSAQVALERARQNLAYTRIYAPIDGVVVERDVDVGQTVAASFAAPQLFVIANDLSRMQILVSVDESDIGRIHQGQTASFTVQAYNGRTFTGTVRQVRLQSKTQDNVVNYTVVVSVANADGKLLPGMTATVKFLTGEADDALLVANAALRVRPPAALLAKGASAAARPAGSGAATLWVPGADRKLAPIAVKTGISDGQRTQVAGAGLTAGMRVVLGVTSGQAGGAEPATTTTGSNPLQQQRQGPPGPPPGGF